MSTKHTPTSPVQRLSRVQQLTLNTWRLAAAKLARVFDPYSVLEQAAVHATLGALRDIDKPLDLFGRHAGAHPEFALITSLVHATPHADLAYDIFDTAFLLRWNELVSDGTGPEELPPLRPHSAAPDQRVERVLTKLEPVGSGLVLADRVEPPAGAFFDLHRQRHSSPTPGAQRTSARVLKHLGALFHTR